MSVIFSFLLCCLLAVIIYQDFRYRGLSVILLISTFLFAVINSIFLNGWLQAFLYAGINVVLIIIQLVLVTAYFSIRHKSVTNIVNKYLGIGDIFFYGVLAFSFSPLIFVFFNLVACMLILIVYVITGFWVKEPQTIPLAGWLAIVMIFTIIIYQVFGILNPYNDYFVASAFF